MLTDKIKHAETEIPLSSLADIVFLLLIFFLVTTQIDMEKRLNLVLPDFTVTPVKENLTKVLINSDGLVAIDGAPVSIDELVPHIKEKLDQKPKMIVSLKTDKNTDYGMYIKVLDKLKIA